ncbi:glycosyltransferase family 4 protein [Novispirillum sp. DQ9]|uniref:glycosyltransferase family 4 protein n=1 Tax=Novispirillum sp. DQ9 TaxID=3398612 RepID=UPI003C7B99B9
MRIALIDDSVPFDGYTPASSPLGGAEKALVGLAKALAARGHEVTVINRCAHALRADGVDWRPWDSPRPLETDALVAYRRPSLLTQVRKAARRVLWLSGPPDGLAKPAIDAALKELNPTLAFIGPTQAARWRGPRLPWAVVPPGIADEYVHAGGRLGSGGPPVAITTTHPAHGLDWLVDLWTARIHPRCPTAELHIYSALLSRPDLGRALPEEFRPLRAKVEAAAAQGVSLREPQGDVAMALAYRAARVHLYPGNRDDMACWTLGETQACGVPAVARPAGAAHERIDNGQTGYIVPDDDAFANVAAQVLNDDGMFAGLSSAAAEKARARTWASAAQAFEALLK